MRHNEKITHQTPPYMSAVIERIPNLVAALKEQCKEIDYLFDLNHAISDCTQSLFTNYWIHCNARGNELCAHYVAEVLQQNNYLET